MPAATPTATQLTHCTASELLQLYRERKASPVEATRAVLARIEALNPRLNAFCLVDPEAALKAAAQMAIAPPYPENQITELLWKDCAQLADSAATGSSLGRLNTSVTGSKN